MAESTQKAVASLRKFKKHQGTLIGRKIECNLEQYVKAHVVGSPKEALEKLRKIRGLGATYFIMYMPTAADTRLLKLLHEEVVKPLREE